MAYIKKRFAVKACLENAFYYFNSGKGWPFLQWLRRWQPILIMANIKVHSSCAKLTALWLKWPRLNLFILDKDGLCSKGGLYVHGWGGQH